jgi:ubiquinone/menaquinone biosynthesis C-methylase UbiE
MNPPETDESTVSHQDPTVIHQYEGWARVYDLFWLRYMQKTLPVMQEAAGIGPGERILDLACGTGELERRVARDHPEAEIVGVDLAGSMVARARTKVGDRSNVRFEAADVHDLPFPPDSFDAVVCANTFHYFTRPEIVLREAARVLRPGGRFVVLDWCRDFWTCRVMDAILHRIDPAYPGCYTEEEMIDLHRAAGLDVCRSFTYRFDVVWGMMVVEARAPNGSTGAPLADRG